MTGYHVDVQHTKIYKLEPYETSHQMATNPYKTYLGGIAGTNELLNGHDENELGNLKHW